MFLYITGPDDKNFWINRGQIKWIEVWEDGKVIITFIDGTIQVLKETRNQLGDERFNELIGL